jgi:alkylresorcinol/alkylpyrone synthase
MPEYFPKILSAAIALPPFTKSLDESWEHIKAWIAPLPERTQKKILRIFRYANVDRRYAIMDIDEVFQETSFQEKNDYYQEKMTDLGEEALRKALDKAGLQATDLDYIITTSCTGLMIPSVDAYLINRLNMRQDIVRLPVTEMGCAAGTSALIYANDFLRANPGKTAAIVALESPMSTFQHRDFSMTNMVSAAIFGDGVACTILGSSDAIRPAIIDTGMYHFPDEIDMMGYNFLDSGFQIVLDKTVPEKIEAHFDRILFPFLERNQLTIGEVNHFIFHPGGKKIVKMVEGLLGELGKNIDESKGVLRDYGNMSSATILYVLERFLDKEIPAADYGLMLAFGPGFSAQRLLLKWQ